MGKLAVLATQSHGVLTSACDCVTKNTCLPLLGEIKPPQTTQNCRDDGKYSAAISGTDLTLQVRYFPRQPRMPVLPRRPGDIGYIVIDVSLLCRHVATRGRGCRPQRVDIQQNKSTRGCNALASTASPNAPISLPFACGHLLLDGQCLKRAHGWGGGL